MVEFHDTLKIVETPFPFPYAQIIALFLFVFAVVTPMVVACWVHNWFLCAVFTFIAVSGFLSINLIAVELEQPFGDDVNDLPLLELQVSVNNMLLKLLDPLARQTPHLSRNFRVEKQMQT